MGYKLTANRRHAQECPINELGFGEIAEVMEDDFGAKGHIVLGVYGGWVSLTNPSHTWMDRASKPDIRVRRLQPGESVTLTVE